VTHDRKGSDPGEVKEGESEPRQEWKSESDDTGQKRRGKEWSDPERERGSSEQ
jgi:hypothetical protein